MSRLNIIYDWQLCEAHTNTILFKGNVGAFEKHWTCAELGRLWHIHPDTVRNIMEKEKGVFVIEHPETCHKRGYKSLRVPASLAEKVYTRHCTK